MQLPDLSFAKRIALDLETRDPNIKTGSGAMRDGYIAGISLATDDGYNEYYPIAHENGTNLDKQKILQWLRVQLGRPNQIKVGANIKYDLEFLALAGVEVKGLCYDVQIAEPLLNEEALSYSLDSLATKYLGEGKPQDYLYQHLANMYGGKPDRATQAKNIWRASGNVVAKYAKADAMLPLKIITLQEIELRKQDLWDLFILESKLIPILLRMKLRGVKVDIPKAKNQIIVMSNKILEAQDILEGVNINGAASIAKLFDKHKIDYPRTAKTNAPSFTKDSLALTDHPIARALEEVRGWTKLRDTFVQNYILDGNINGRIHGEFHQLKSDDTGTVSGRLSSSNPNLQNIPTKGGGIVREIFLPEEGEDWYCLDWSQIEYRFLAHYAIGKGSDEVRDTYITKPDTDFHDMVAELTGVDRKYAKAINFGLLYGMGKDKLSRSLHKTIEEAEEIFKIYHARAPFIKSTYAMATQKARVRGYIYTTLKRRRRFANGLHTHKALNALLQGSAADMMKLAMVSIAESGVENILGPALLTVHDELDLSVPRTKEGKEAVEHVKWVMENCMDLAVPVLVDMEKGSNWGNVK